MGYKNAAAFDTLRSVAFGSLTTSYVIVGAALTAPAVCVAFKNNTDGIVLVSTDGSTDMLIFPPLSYGVYDVRTNAPNVTDYLISEGTPFMVKYSSC